MPQITWPALLAALLRGDSLTTADAAWAMGEIMSGDATPAQVAGFVTALKAKGETADEVTGLVDVMLANAAPVEGTHDAVDIVGTGGDGARTVNISTMAAIVTAAAGVPVVKHGNRAASSASGSADLLEALGVQLEASPEEVAASVAEIGIGFCFAPRFHPGMRHAAAPRRELGIPTVFNFLGPLTNPARPRAAAVGCADVRMAPVMATVLGARAGVSALVMRGEDGLDEFTTAAPTRLWVASEGAVRETVLDTVDLGLARSRPGDLTGGDANHNADVARRIFAGEAGPIRDAVLINAAAAIAAFDGFGTSDEDLVRALRTGIDRAANAIDTGRATALLKRWTNA